MRGAVSPGGGIAAEAVTVASIAPGPARKDGGEAVGGDGSKAFGGSVHSAAGGSTVVADVAHEEMDARCCLGSTSHLTAQVP